VVRSRGQHCGDVEQVGYLANAAGPVPLVLDLHIAHDRFGNTSDPNLNGQLHYPQDIDKSLNEAASDKIRKYNNNPPNDVSFYRLFLVHRADYIVNLSNFYSYSLIGKLTAFFHLQEFSQRNQTWDLRTSTFAAWRSLISLSQNVD